MSGGLIVRELAGGGGVAFTTRAEGNLSSVSGVERERAAAAREILREKLGLRALARSHQVHGTFVRRLDPGISDEEASDSPEADGHATTLRGVGLMAFGADCLPVAIGSRGAVAIVHAGWRGLAAGVLEEGVRSLRELDREGEISAVIGPGAGVCCYEVGEEVHAAFGGRHRDGQNIDLPALARERLLAAGVDLVELVGRCTICDEAFFSHRREGDRAGRQAGVAWLR